MSASELAHRIVIEAGGGYDPSTESLATVVRRAMQRLSPRNETERRRIRAAAYREAGDKTLNWLRARNAELQRRNTKAIQAAAHGDFARLEQRIAWMLGVDPDFYGPDIEQDRRRVERLRILAD